MFEILYHHRSSNEQSHNSRHDCDTQDAAERMIRPLPGRALRSNVPRGVQPEPPLLRLLLWNFQPLSSPEPFNTAIADGPNCFFEQCCNPAITVSPKLSGQLDNIRNKSVFISVPFGNMSLCRAILPQPLTSLTLRNFELAAHMINASTATSGTQKFPLADSFKINLSSVKSDTALLSWSFSFWSRFSSFN